MEPTAPGEMVPIEEEEPRLPERHALASSWEENPLVRKNLRESGKLLRWPNREMTGIATLAALGENRVIIEDALTLWASHNSTEAKSPPVEWLKDEACVDEMKNVFK